MLTRHLSEILRCFLVISWIPSFPFSHITIAFDISIPFICRTWTEMERRHMDHHHGHLSQSGHWTGARPSSFPNRKSMHGSAWSLASHLLLLAFRHRVFLHLFFTIWLGGHWRGLFLEANGHSSGFCLFVFSGIVEINYVGHIRFGWVARPYQWLYPVCSGYFYDGCGGKQNITVF